MLRKHIDPPDERAFLDEVLRSVEKADPKDKIKVLSRAFMAFRGWCYGATAVMMDETSTKDEMRDQLFYGAAMYYPEGEWRRFGELLYPKEGPMLERMQEAAKKYKKR